MEEELIYQRLSQCNNALSKNRDDLEIKNVKGKGKGISVAIAVGMPKKGKK